MIYCAVIEKDKNLCYICYIIGVVEKDNMVCYHLKVANIQGSQNRNPAPRIK